MNVIVIIYCLHLLNLKISYSVQSHHQSLIIMVSNLFHSTKSARQTEWARAEIIRWRYHQGHCASFFNTYEVDGGTADGGR